MILASSGGTPAYIAADGDEPVLTSGPLSLCAALGEPVVTNTSDLIAFAGEQPGFGKGLFVATAPGTFGTIVKQGDTGTGHAGVFGPPTLLDLNNLGTALFRVPIR